MAETYGSFRSTGERPVTAPVSNGYMTTKAPWWPWTYQTTNLDYHGYTAVHPASIDQYTLKHRLRTDHQKFHGTTARIPYAFKEQNVHLKYLTTYNDYHNGLHDPKVALTRDTFRHQRERYSVPPEDYRTQGPSTHPMGHTLPGLAGAYREPLVGSEGPGGARARTAGPGGRPGGGSGGPGTPGRPSTGGGAPPLGSLPFSRQGHPSNPLGGSNPGFGGLNSSSRLGGEITARGADAEGQLRTMAARANQLGYRTTYKDYHTASAMAFQEAYFNQRALRTQLRG